MLTGRPPLSIAQKRANGDTKKLGSNKHAEATSPSKEAARGIPDMPKCLNAVKGDSVDQRRRLTVARAHWKYIAQGLHREKRLAQIDEGMLTTVALAYALMVEAAKSDDWRTRRMYPELHSRYMQATDRMGLNESARARIPAHPGEESDPLMDQIGPQRKTA